MSVEWALAPNSNPAKKVGAYKIVWLSTRTDASSGNLSYLWQNWLKYLICLIGVHYEIECGRAKRAINIEKRSVESAKWIR